MKFSKYHPNHRYFVLSHIRQVRMMIRDGRYVCEGRELIKEAQQRLADYRAARTAA